MSLSPPDQPPCLGLAGLDVIFQSGCDLPVSVLPRVVGNASKHRNFLENGQCLVHGCSVLARIPECKLIRTPPDKQASALALTYLKNCSTTNLRESVYRTLVQRAHENQQGALTYWLCRKCSCFKK